MFYELIQIHSGSRGDHSQSVARHAQEQLRGHLAGLWKPDAPFVQHAHIALAAWEDFDTRDRVLAPLRADPVWQNAPRESWIVAATAGAPDKPGNLQSPALFEFRVQKVVNGSQPAAGQSFWNTYAPEIANAGGRVIAQFDVVLGPDRPVLVTVLEWPDHVALHDGWRKLDRVPALISQRETEIRDIGRPFFEQPQQWLLRSMMQ